MKNSPNGHGLFTRADGLIAAGLGIGFLTLYVRTLAPGLLPGDSGEFQTLAHFYSTAHTNGYPIYLLLARWITYLPVGDIAYRVNLFSAVMAALAVAGVYLLGRLVLQEDRSAVQNLKRILGRFAAGVSAAALGLTITVWSQAIIAEVYTTAAAWICAVLLFVMLWYRTRRGRFLFLAALLGGLSMGAHGTVLLAAPAVLLFIVLSRPAGTRTWLPALGGGLLGLALLVSAYLAADTNRAPYNIFNTVYLPAASAWGLQPEDLQSPARRIAFLVSSRQWRSAMFADPVHVMPRNLRAFTRVLVNDYGFLLPLVMLAGLVNLSRRDWRVGLLFATAAGVHLLYTANYQIGDLNVFNVPAYVYLSVLLGGGIAWLSERLLHALELRRGLLPAAPTAPAAPAAVLAVFGALVLLPHAGLSWDSLVRGSYNATTAPPQGGAISVTGNPFEEPGSFDAWRADIRATAGALEKNAIVFMDWNHVYPYYYTSLLELGRTDLAFIEAAPYSAHPGLPATSIDLIRASRRPVYFLHYDPTLDLKPAGFDLQPVQVGPSRLIQVKP